MACTRRPPTRRHPAAHALSTRDGTGLVEYYAGLGWTEFGRLPGAVHIGEGRYYDEVWLRLPLV